MRRACAGASGYAPFASESAMSAIMRGPRSFASPCGAVYPALCILAVCTRGAFAFFNLGLVSFRFFYVAPTPAPLRAGLARTATSTGAGNKPLLRPPTVRACSNGVHKVCSQGSQVGDLKCCRLADGSTEHARACGSISLRYAEKLLLLLSMRLPRTEQLVAVRLLLRPREMRHENGKAQERQWAAQGI